MEKICEFFRTILIWGNNEPPIVLFTTTVGSIVMLLAAYATIVYLLPLTVSAAIKKIRRTKFVRRIDRLVYMLQKEYGRKSKPTRLEPGESRVIMTLEGNLNDSQ